MTLHHTAVVLGDNSMSPARLRQHQNYHMDSLGWIDIAYHIGIDRNGNVFELRTTKLAGDTATDYDTSGHFLVVCEGNFDEEPVSEAQIDSAARTFAWAVRSFGVTSQTLAGHRDVAPGTDCPGTDLYAYLANGELRERIDGYLLAGRVELAQVCGSQADAMVAGIEAGR
jgi:hypothetical protein